MKKMGVRKRDRSLKNANLSNEYLFQQVMLNKKINKMVLEELLLIKIDKIKSIRIEDVKKLKRKSKGIRLDVFIRDNKGNAYDIEMQGYDDDLGRRSGYYHSIMQMEITTDGMKYKDIPDRYVIFISTYDYVGLGMYVNTFSTRCNEDYKKVLNDGKHTIIFNTQGTKGEVTETQKEFLEYINDSSHKKTRKLKTKFVKEVAKYTEIVRVEKEEEYMGVVSTLAMEYKDIGEAKGIDLTIEVLNLYKSGKTVQEIMEITKLSKTKIEKMMKILK